MSRGGSFHLEVDLPDGTDRGLVAEVLENLLKSLLQQRKQIPTRLDLVRKDVAQFPEQDQDLTDEEDVEEDGDDIRSILSEKRARVKQRGQQRKYLQKARDFVTQYDSLWQAFKAELLGDSHGLVSVAFLFGSTPSNPKEVYRIVLPEGLPPHSASGEGARARAQKAGQALFRKMVTSEEVFSILGRPLRATNVFLAVEKGQHDPPCGAWAEPMDELRIGRKTVSATFQLRLPKRRTASVSTPVPMEICTPFGKRPFDPVCLETPMRLTRTTDEDMEVTPCVKPKRRITGCRMPSFSEDVVNDDEAVGDLMEELDISGEQNWFVSSEKLNGFRDPRIKKRDAY